MHMMCIMCVYRHGEPETCKKPLPMRRCNAVEYHSHLLARACAADRLTGRPSFATGVPGPRSGAASNSGSAAAAFDASAACWSSIASRASGLALLATSKTSSASCLISVLASPRFERVRFVSVPPLTLPERFLAMVDALTGAARPYAMRHGCNGAVEIPLLTTQHTLLAKPCAVAQSRFARTLPINLFRRGR